jgi:hypothetical protein
MTKEYVSDVITLSLDLTIFFCFGLFGFASNTCYGDFPQSHPDGRRFFLRRRNFYHARRVQIRDNLARWHLAFGDRRHGPRREQKSFFNSLSAKKSSDLPNGSEFAPDCRLGGIRPFTQEQLQ